MPESTKRLFGYNEQYFIYQHQTYRVGQAVDMPLQGTRVVQASSLDRGSSSVVTVLQWQTSLQLPQEDPPNIPSPSGIACIEIISYVSARNWAIM